MEEGQSNGGGGGNVISAVAGLIGSVVDYFTVSKQVKYDRLPDWLSPKDFQRKDHTADLILIGMLIVLLAVIIAIIRANK
ncbi:MAG: hypothetical protein R2824_15865 [Saprospiraceae bacterium]